MRLLTRLALSLLFAAAPAQAALELTGACDDSLTATERRILETAVVDADANIADNAELVLRVGTTCTRIDPPGGWDPGPGMPPGGFELPDEDEPAEVLGPSP